MKQSVFVRIVALLLSASLLVSCGGGGGNSRSACSDLNVRVFGGDQCNAQSSPVVPLYAISAEGGLLGTCTATLITIQHVLTAAHCAELTRLPGVVVVAAYVNGELNPIASGVSHPLYEGSVDSPFDIAVVTLYSPVPIGPVPLLLSKTVTIGDKIDVFGYGLNEDPQNSPADFRAAYMTVTEMVPGLFGATFDDTGTSICQGDSGGPVTETVNGVTGIVGVTSFTINGCTEGSVSGFVHIQYSGLYEFILANAPSAQVI